MGAEDKDKIEGAAGAQPNPDDESATAGQSSPVTDPTQGQTGGGDKGDPPPPEAKGKGAKGKDAAKNLTPPPAPPAKEKTVRVIVPEGTTLGRLMLTNGQTTTDPEYVALLDIKGQKKVEAVK